MLRANAIYAMYLFPLSICIYTVASRKRGVEGCYALLLQLLGSVLDLSKILSRNIPNYRSVDQSRFTQQAVVVFFFLSGSSILWQYKRILSCKQNTNLKHTKAVSAKPLRRMKFMFPPSPFLHFRFRQDTAYIWSLY